MINDYKVKILVITSAIIVLILSGIVYYTNDPKSLDSKIIPDTEIENNLRSNNPAKMTRISQDLQTNFGEYPSNNLDYNAAIIPTSINRDLSNVDLQGLFVTPEIKEELSDHGFTLSKSNVDDIYSFYQEGEGIPKFITTDLVLHAYHVLYDLSLRIIEGEYLSDAFETLLLTLHDAQITLSNTISKPEITDALQSNIAYLSVMIKLLDENYTINPWVDDLVTSELALIKSEKIAVSPIF